MHKREQEIYQYHIDYASEHGKMPALKTVATHFGVKVNTAQTYRSSIRRQSDLDAAVARAIKQATERAAERAKLSAPIYVEAKRQLLSRFISDCEACAEQLPKLARQAEEDVTDDAAVQNALVAVLHAMASLGEELGYLRAGLDRLSEAQRAS